MATSTDWPTGLPQLFQKGSFSGSKQGNLLRTEMDSGLAKTRRLFTAVAKYWSGTMIMTNVELTTFETFFDTAIASGALTFNFPNPYDYGATTDEARFRIDTKTEPYTFSVNADTLDWDVSINLETIP